MYHGLIINGKNTFDEFGLIPTSRPVINPPEPRLSYVEVPGRSGNIDISEVLTGSIAYENRMGSFKFLVSDKKSWTDTYSKLLSFLQGIRAQVILEDEPEFYYEGRLYLSEWKSSKNHSNIVIEYDLAPFKYEVTSSNAGYQKIEKSLTGGSQTVSVDTNEKILEGTVTCAGLTSSGLKATFGNMSMTLVEGINILPNVYAGQSLRISGYGTIDWNYRKGRL